MYTNHAKAIKGLSIANIVLGVLGILGSLGGCAALGSSAAIVASSGYDYIPLDDGYYMDTAAAAGLMGMLTIFAVFACIAAIFILVAGIVGAVAAEHVAAAGILRPHDNIQDVDVASVVTEENDGDKPQA